MSSNPEYSNPNINNVNLNTTDPNYRYKSNVNANQQPIFIPSDNESGGSMSDSSYPFSLGIPFFVPFGANQKRGWRHLGLHWQHG